MKPSISLGLAAVTTLLAVAISGCAFEDADPRPPEGPIARRAFSVVVEGCVVVPSMRATLAAPETRAVLGEVILRCPRLDATASVSFPGADAKAIGALVTDLHGLGYKVTLAIGLVDDGTPAATSTLEAFRARGTWTVAAATAAWGAMVGADDLDLALPPLRDTDGPALEGLVSALEGARAAAGSPRRVGMFVPPTSMVPSDIPGGDAYDLRSLSPKVRIFRAMTLDYSCCGAPYGPTTEPGWTVDVMRFFRGRTSAPMDVAYPLYGIDFGPSGERAVGSVEARKLAETHGSVIARGPTGAPHFSYTQSGSVHDVWFDDAVSTTWALRAWTPKVLPADVGVVFYGLGAEDPELFRAVAGALEHAP